MCVRRAPRVRRALPSLGDLPRETPRLRHYGPVSFGVAQGHTTKLAPRELCGSAPLGVRHQPQAVGYNGACMPSLVPTAASAIVHMQRRTPPLPVLVFVHIGLLCLGLRTLAQGHFVTACTYMFWHKHTLLLPMPVCACKGSLYRHLCFCALVQAQVILPVSVHRGNQGQHFCTQ